MQVTRTEVLGEFSDLERREETRRLPLFRLVLSWDCVPLARGTFSRVCRLANEVCTETGGKHEWIPLFPVSR